MATSRRQRNSAPKHTNTSALWGYVTDHSNTAAEIRAYNRKMTSAAAGKARSKARTKKVTPKGKK